MRRHLLRSLGISALAILMVSCSEYSTELASPGGMSAVTTTQMKLVGPSVVISQVYGGSSNGGALYKNDFVELFNRTGADVDISNWSVQYASKAGTFSGVAALPANSVIHAGRYFLIQLKSGTATTAASLPTPDAVFASPDLSGTDGKVLLSNQKLAVAGTCPATSDVVDHVGYGTITCTPDVSWTTVTGLGGAASAIRAGGGCTYTGSNATSADFSAGTPNPRNSASPANPCDDSGGTPPPPVDSIAISPIAPTIEVGDIESFHATSFDAARNPITANVTWSADATVATIDKNSGQLTATRAGSTLVTATAENGKSSSTLLTITPLQVPGVVISQVYAGGGNSGAVFTNDFVELFNPGNTAVAIGDFSVQYTTSSSWSVTAIPSNTTLLAGQYYLVQLASQAAVGAALPTADATGTSNMAASAGKVVLARNTTALTDVCPSGADIVDRVNYGSGNCADAWGATPAPSATLAALRNNDGCDYSKSSTRDFATGTPVPRNTSSSRKLCHAVAGEVVTVNVSPATFSLEIAATQTMTASAIDAFNQPAPTSITWSSSNDAVATVDASTGVVTANAAGNATITATSANGIKGNALLTVKGPAEAPTGIVITEVLGNPDGDETVREWFEVYNAGTADVDLQGWQIRSAKSTGPDETHTIASSVVVRAGGFAVLGNSANKQVNDNVDVAYTFPSAEITLSNGSNTEWLALHTASGATADSVAYSARNAQGIVTDPIYLPVSGTAREVIDIAQDNSVIGGSNWRDVTSPYGAGTNHGTPGYGAYGVAGPVVRIAIAPSPASVVGGTTQALSGLALDALGRISNEALTWSSSDTDIATIDAQGVATGKIPGSVTITATAASGATGTTTLVVIDPDAPATITVNVDAGLLPAGSERRVLLSVKAHDGRSVSAPIVWSVSDPTILAIDNYDGRVYVRGLREGTADIVAKADNGVFGTHTQQILPQVVPTSAVYRNHIEFGLPTNGDPGDTIIITHAGYVSSYNPARGGPNWVSWNLNATHFGSADRCNCFSPDQSLPGGLYKVNDTDYIGAGYDRGHMVQSESRTSTVEENAATFYMTNILPQAALNNQQTWLAFETFLDDLAQTQGKDIYIIAGGEYGANPQILNGHVAIPDYTWKIAVVLPSGKGLSDVTTRESAQVYAVNMPNLVATATGGTNWQQYQTTVDAIEAVTGYDYLNLLPDSLEDLIESNDHSPVVADLPTFAGIDGSDIAFAGSATDIDANDNLTYSWTFGDGTNAVGKTVAHTYETPGTFDVRLIVTDSHRMADTTVTTVSVAVSPAPTATFHSTDALNEGGTIGLSFTDPVDAHLSTVTYAFDCGSGYGTFGTASEAVCPTVDNGTVVVHGKVRNQRGKETEYTASAAVANVAPTASIVAPASVFEGSSITFSLTNATDVSSADAAAGFTYAFACGNGAPTPFAATSFSSCATTDDGSVTVTAVVRDKDGATSSYTQTVAVTNVAPIVAPFSGATILAGETYTTTGSFADPGADTWTGVVSYGDSVVVLGLNGKNFLLSNTFSIAGTYAVTVAVTDDDGGSGVDTATVVVQSAAQGATALGSTITTLENSGDIPAATAGTLTQTLESASESLAAKDNASGVNRMRAFKNQVDAAVNARKISTATGSSLNAVADRIIASANKQ